MKKISLLLVIAFINLTLFAQLRLPAIFGDNMVLQRKNIVTIWGWESASAKIRLVAGWNTKDTIQTTCNDMAKWSTQLQTPDAGGPYTITILGKQQLTLNNIMIGEVWLCSGQSNMEWTYSHGGLKDKEKEVAAANYPNIRIFSTQRIASQTSQDNCYGEWKECSPETLPSTSATAYFFARKLHQELNIPVGIVISAWGGTSAEVWTPEEKVKQNKTLHQAAASIKPTPWWPIVSGCCYNSMIYPLIPFSFAGVIWYQGESNVERHDSYDLLMRTLIDSWRENFKTQLPFYFVQIAPFANYNPKGNIPKLREAQEKTSEYEGCGMVVINDLIDDVNNIHPANKIDVGVRLANLALKNNYGKDAGGHTYPKITHVTLSAKNITLTVESPTGIKIIKNDGFQIAGEDGNFMPASIKLGKKNEIVLSAKNMKNPKYVRYLFDDASLCSIISVEGLPLLPFRNDNF